ncbi:MAG: DUF1028 domain-containing protein [Deinococcota bacterium]|jgi:uncharacterized Ntn-hydrolase superfamily protein|nr:DUF1028 domain-containing protein [Deinococcota bacterium]
MSAISTFSIVARDAETGDLGVATASKFLAVGGAVPYARAEVGAVATQSYANTSYGPRALAALKLGVPLDAIHQAFMTTDSQHPQRQYGLVDAGGNSLTFTGAECHAWAGGKRGQGYAAQGNLLTGPEVVERLVAAFEASAGPLAERLMAALAAGDEAGGDRRGRQSAALLVVRRAGGYGGFNDRYIDLRVDDHDDPVPELSRLLSLQRLFFERPHEENRLEIKGDVAGRLGEILVRSGHLESSHGWDEASEKALRSLAGVENLEERMLEPGLVDRVVLDYLEKKYGG